MKYLFFTLFSLFQVAICLWSFFGMDERAFKAQIIFLIYLAVRISWGLLTSCLMFLLYMIIDKMPDRDNRQDQIKKMEDAMLPISLELSFIGAFSGAYLALDLWWLFGGSVVLFLIKMVHALLVHLIKDEAKK